MITLLAHSFDEETKFHLRKQDNKDIGEYVLEIEEPGYTYSFFFTEEMMSRLAGMVKYWDSLANSGEITTSKEDG